jgi:hypothetical protein
VHGTVAALLVKAEQASLAEVLGALQTSLGVRHRSQIALDDVRIGGTYSGTLEDVLRRVLAGLNYIIKTREDAIDIIIVGRPGTAPQPLLDTPPPLPTNVNPAAQWRAATRKP